MKKILFIHNKYRHIGGEDTAVNQEIALLKEVYDVKVIIFENTIKNYFWQTLYFLTNKNLNSKKILQEALNDFKPDVAYIHNTWFKASLVVFTLLKKNNVEILLKLHNFRYYCTKSFLLKTHLNRNTQCPACGIKRNKGKLFNKYFQDSYLRSLFVIFYGKLYYKILKEFKIKVLVLTEFHKQFIKNLDLKNDQIYVYPNYVELKVNEKPSNEKYILYAGRISREKGVERVIISYNNSGLKDTKLKIIGVGPEYERLKKKYKNIIFLGEMKNKEVLEIISKASAVISATRLLEGQPMLLCEASSMAVPSIFPKTGGIEEFFPENYELSFIQFDYVDLSRKIKLLDNRELCKKVGQENYDFISKFYSKKSILRKFEKILHAK